MKPANNSSLTMYWNCCNDIVISRILNTVLHEIRQSIMYIDSAKAIWDDLSTHFSHTNIPKLFDLRKEIFYLNQGNMSISAYFTKFRSLNDELEVLSDMPKCTCNKCICNVNAKISTYMKSIMLAQFLMGLNEQYTVIQGHILMITPPPPLSKAYAILLQEEHQREKHIPTLPSEPTVMAVKQCNEYGNRNFKPAKKTTIDSSTLLCDYCQLQGHTRDKCLCLHGYPDWHRLHGKPKAKPRHQTGKSHSQANHVMGGDNSSQQLISTSGSNKKDASSFYESQC